MVENQATDRAFRIDQTGNVRVHKFLTQGRVEERIDRLMAEKQQLADDILTGDDEVKLTELSDEALGDIFAIDLDTEDDTFAAPKVPEKKAA